jgi:hypothetical protein
MTNSSANFLGKGVVQSMPLSCRIWRSTSQQGGSRLKNPMAAVYNNNILHETV